MLVWHMVDMFLMLRLDVRMDGQTLTLDTAASQKALLEALLESALESDLARGVVRSGAQGLARRYLPPGRPSDLYQLYLSHQIAHKAPAASSSTFFRVFNETGWKQVLRFRAKSQHTMCTTCHKLKVAIRKAKGVQEHARQSDRLYRHLAGQFTDRKVYAELKARSRYDRDLLTVICDGMDKSKFSLPRYHEGRTPKALETVARPSCEVYAVILHGHAVCTYVTDCDQSAGAAWVMEVLGRSFDVAFKASQRQGKPWPSVVKVFADNTPKDQETLSLLDCSGFA